MRILYIAKHLNKGGITSYLFSLATGLKKRGHDITIASSGGDSKEAFASNGIRLIDIPINTKKEISPALLFSYFMLSRVISQERPDIIHAHTRVTQVLAWFLSRRFKIPLVTTCHGFFKPRWHRRIFPCWGNKVIAISSAVKRHLVNDFKVRDSDVRLVYNGIDLDKFKSYPRAEIDKLKQKIGVAQANIVVGTVARFSSVKGLDYLVKAIPLVLKENDKVMLLLIGYGEEEARLRRICKDLKIEDKVIFFKPSQDSFEYLPAIDIFVMPSIQEGLGLSMLEAQAYKITVIASRVGGIPDIIEDNVTGILINPKDELAISKAISRLSKDKGFCSEIVNRAYEKLTSVFSLEKMVLDTEKIYKEFRP